MKRNSPLLTILIAVAAVPLFSCTILALESDDADWPTWRFDAGRRAQTPHELSEDLQLQWLRELPEPERAWQHQTDDLGKLDFDVSYTPVVMGRKIFVPSNVNDNVTAYSIEDGSEIWRFYANGPVRLAPSAWRDRLFFVSDDGFLYCVGAESGNLLWKFRAGPSDHRLLGNGRIINFWAARGGPVVKDSTVYFAAGLWPLHGIFIYALEAESGKIVWVNDSTGSDYVQLPHGGARGYGGLVPQGYLAASEDRLVVAGGRTPPAYFNRHTGELEEAEFRPYRSVSDSKGAGGYAVHAGGMGKQKNEMLQERVDKLSGEIEGEVFYKLAAHGRLFLTTEDGLLYCFGTEEKEEAVRYDSTPVSLKLRSNDWAEVAEYLLEQAGESGGYALMLGAGSGDLLKELLGRGELHVVVVEEKGEKVRSLRDELVEAAMYGRRAAVIEASPAAFSVQPYLFSMIVSEDAKDAGIVADSLVMDRILDCFRPYGGIAWLGASPVELPALFQAASAANVDQVHLQAGEDHLFARREGPLSGAGQWTHQNSDPSNTNSSRDSRVKTPLGVLWFGGPCNNNILPRHTLAPVPQVSGGRIILLGPESVSARCVYTGREIWERHFPAIGFAFTDPEWEEKWREGQYVHMINASGAGANQLGSPYVSLSDALYVRYKTRVYRLEPKSGEVLDEFQLPVGTGLQGKVDWGHISVWEDLLITTVEPQVFHANHYSAVYQTMDDIAGETERRRRRNPSWDGTSSARLVVMNRHSGEVVWSRGARTGFRHNSIVIGGGRLFLIDGLTEGAVDLLRRRGKEPEDAILLALDPYTGEEKWTNSTDIFGTWLGYSEDHDILVQGGRQGGLALLRDEPAERVAAYLGSSGSMIWQQETDAYWGPLSIQGENVYMAPTNRGGRRGGSPAGSSPVGFGRALNLLDGKTKTRGQLHVAESVPWTYWRRYGCNSHNVSEHLITFRSGSAGFFDLEHDSGTGSLSGFRSGCTNNLVIADGVLIAPDYTRTCACSYAHQTSLAFIHMPEDSNIEFWTRYEGGAPDPEGHGINFGAPGRRVDLEGGGLVWHDAAGTRRRHPSAITQSNGTIDWVAASLREGEDDFHIGDLLDMPYTVHFHFAELDEGVEAGARVFDIYIDGKRVLEGFDIVEETGGPFRGVVKSFSVAVADEGIRVELRRSADARLDPVISGIQVMAYE